MSDVALFLLMLAGMLGYLALIGRVLARRRGGKAFARPAAAKRHRPVLPQRGQR